MEELEIDGFKYFIKINFHNKPKIRATISQNKINIKIPDFLNREEKFKQILKMKNWAINKIKEDPERFKPEKQKEYKDGDKINVRGKEYLLTIRFDEKNSSSARICCNNIYLSISNRLQSEEKDKYITSLLNRCIARLFLPDVIEKITELNKNYFNNQKIKKISLKNIRSRWGSCSTDKNINISTRSLLLPDDVFEYICIHELAHLIEQNHSESFWSLVEKAMPNYKEKINWVKENTRELRF